MSMLQLEVVTPDKTVVSAQVDMAVCPGVMGEFGVLPHHVSLLSALKIGNLRYTEGGKQHNVFISGGFADVNNKVLTVLAESAELAEDIDTALPVLAYPAHLADYCDTARAPAAMQRA